MMQLHATGFAGHLQPLNGTYQQTTSNHNRPQYTKATTEIEGCNQSCVYFWDARDGENLSGWWVAPVVGGEQVWAFNPQKTATPPPSGWKVPWHSDQVSPTLQMHLSKPGGKRPDAGYEDDGPAAKQAKLGPGPAGMQVMTPAQLTQRAAQQEKFLTQLRNQAGNVERAVDRAKAASDRVELGRLVNVAKNSITSTKKAIDTCQKGPLFGGEGDAAKLTPILEVVTRAEADMLAYETESNKEQLESAKELTRNLPEKTEKYLADIEKLVEETKDVTVVLTCELSDHSSPEDILKVDEEAETSSKKAMELITEMKKYLAECEAAVRTFPDLEKIETLKEKTVQCRSQLVEFETGLRGVKTMIMPQVMKAKNQVAQKQREADREKMRLEQAKKAEEAQKKMMRATEIGLYADYIQKGLSIEDSTDEDIKKVQAKLLGLLRVLDQDYNEKGAIPGLKQGLAKKITNIRKSIQTLMGWGKERAALQDQVRDAFDTLLAAELGRLTEEKGWDAHGNDMFRSIAQAKDGVAIEDVQLSFLKLKKWIAKEILPDGGDAAEAEKHLGASWHKAVICKQQIQNVRTEATKREGMTEEEKMTPHEVDPLEVDIDLAKAKKETIGFTEFYMYIQNAFWIAVNRVGITDSKEIKAAPSTIAQLEMDDVVCVHDGPEMIQAPAAMTGGLQPAQCRMEVSRLRDQKKGWLTLRARAGMPNSLEKYNNIYTIQTETVLTDTYELKGFKVIRRVTAGEKVVGMGLPQVNEDSSLLRVKVMAVLDGSLGYITVKGSQGTLFLTSDVLNKAREDQKHFTPAMLNNLDVQSEEDGTWKLVVGEDKTVLESVWAEKDHKTNIVKVAESIPKSLEKRLEDLAEQRLGLQEQLNEFEGMAKKVTDWKKPEKVEGEVSKPEDNYPPFMNQGFEKEIQELNGELESKVKDVTQELLKIRKEGEAMLMELKDIPLAPEYLMKKKLQKDGEPMEIDDDDSPDLTVLTPFQMLRYNLIQIVQQFEETSLFLRGISQQKLKHRAELDRVWLGYKQTQDKKTLKDMVEKLGKTVLAKHELVVAAQNDVTKLIEEIAPDAKGLAKEQELAPVPPQKGTGWINQPKGKGKGKGWKGMGKDGNEFSEESQAPAQPEPPKGPAPPKVLDLATVLSSSSLPAAKMMEMTETLTDSLKALDTLCNDLTNWCSENHPSKSCQLPVVAGGVRMPNAVRNEIIYPVHYPFDQLRRGVQAARLYATKNIKFVEKEFMQKVVSRSRIDIALHFLENDPVKAFKKMAAKNPENKKLADDEKVITCKQIVGCIENDFEDSIPEAVIEKMYETVMGSTKRGMSQYDFVNLFASMHYRVLRSTTMTDVINLKDNFKTVKRLQLGDICKLTSDFKTVNNITRFAADVVPEDDKVEGEKGYVSLKGNHGTTFFALHSPGYKVIKETVMTDVFEMADFKPIIRLKVGDQVRCLEFPRKEAGSGLVRVKAVTVGNDSKGAGTEFSGYVTVEGNQSSLYLEAVDKLVYPEDKPAEEKKDAKEEDKSADGTESTAAA